MSKLVHFLGYASALGVVGILILTATGRLSPVLRGDLGYSSSSDMMGYASSSSDMMMSGDSSDAMTDEGSDGSVMMVPSLFDPTVMVPADYNDMSQTEIEVTQSDEPAPMSKFEPETGTSGGDGGLTAGATGAGAAAAMCAPGVDKQTKGASTANITINGSKKPADSKFTYQAQVPIDKELKNLCKDGKDVACADPANCVKDPNKPSKASYTFGACKVTAGPTAIKDKNGKTTGWKATVQCEASKCETTQECIAKQHCCYTDGDKTIAACKATCDATEVDGGTYAPADCPGQCKPVNILCCQPATGSPTCNPSCPSGSTKKAVLGVNNCNATTCSSSSSSVMLCCKNTLGNNNYQCKATCGTGESGVPIVGTCDTTTNCKFSSSTSSPTPQVCCTNSNNQYYCKATCDSYSPIGVSITGTCDTTTNCKISSTPSSPPTTVPNPPPPPPNSGGSSSRCTGTTPTGTACSNTNSCDSSKGDCYCYKPNATDINGTCK